MFRGFGAGALTLLLAATLTGCSPYAAGGPLRVEGDGGGACTPSDDRGVAYDSVGIIRLHGPLTAEIVGVDLVGADHLELVAAVLGPGFDQGDTLLGAGTEWPPTGEAVWVKYGPALGRHLHPGEPSHDVLVAVRRTAAHGRLTPVSTCGTAPVTAGSGSGWRPNWRSGAARAPSRRTTTRGPAAGARPCAGTSPGRPGAGPRALSLRDG
jgi:hypothetical protein